MKPQLRKVSDSGPTTGDKTLKLTMEEYEVLQRFWWAVGQFHGLLDQDGDSPSDVLGIVLESVGPVFDSLDRQQSDLSNQQ